MTKYIRACALILALLGALPAGTKADVIERVVAVVNDEAILLSELRRAAAPFLPTVVADVKSATERKERISELYRRVLAGLVDEKLIDQTAKSSHITVSSLEVDQAISNVRNQNGMSEDEFWNAVQSQGFTKKKYRQDVRKQLLRLKVTNQRVRSRINVSDDSVREVYNQRVRAQRRMQRFRAAHIFFELPPEASATELAAVMGRAKSVRQQLTPQTFDSAMEEAGGGDLGWLDQGALPVVLETTLLELGPGEISPAVRGPSGVHIFLLRERQKGAEQVPTYAQAAEGIRRELMERAMARQQKLFGEELRRSAVIDLRP